MPGITGTTDGAVATITISNPDRRNALSAADAVELAETVHGFAADEAVRCLVLTGDERGGAFCAGADLRTFEELPADRTALIERSFHRAVSEVMRAKKPVLAKVDGPAAGAGASLATACDFVYATEDARFGWVFVNVGLTIDSGASFVLPRLMGVRKAMELVTTGEILDPETALDLGIVTEVVPSGDIDEHVAAMAEELAAGPTLAIGEAKRLLLRGTSATLDEALADEARAQALMLDTADSSEGRRAFLEGRAPEFEGR